MEEQKNELMVSFTAEVGNIAADQFPKIKEWVDKVTEGYKNAIVSEEGIKDAKADLASLRKVQEKLEDERKRIKGIWNEPYLEWEKRYKDAVSGIKEAINNLDVQVKDFAEKKRLEKEAEIKKSIMEDAHDFGLEVEMFVKNNPAVFNRLYRDEYSNSSFSVNKATTQWREGLRQIMIDLETIGTDELLLSKYAELGSLGDAMIAVKSIKESQKEFLEMKRGEEESNAIRPLQTLPAEEEKPSDDSSRLSIEVPDESTLSESDKNVARLRRTYIGPKYKCLLLLKIAELLGLEVEKEN